MSLIKSGGGAKGASLLLSVALCVAITLGFANAQQTAPAAGALFSTEPAPVIQNIVVRGNQRIEPETIGSYLPIQPGMRAEQEFLDLALKTLFNTGLFADISLEMQEGDILLIEVQENPIVNRVILEGNKRLKDDKLTEEIQLAPRAIYTRAKVQSDVQRMIELVPRKRSFCSDRNAEGDDARTKPHRCNL